jgi:putative cardiolipin synthase
MLRNIFVTLCFVLSFGSIAAEVQILGGGRESFKLRLELIQKAEKEILISYFIFADDETSRVFLSELRTAARRNVKIQILVDSMFNEVPPALLNHLADEGIDFRVYNKITWKNFWHFSHRMHDKVFMVDGKTVIIGGRKIENTYYDQSEGKKNYYDRDILISGSPVDGLRTYFLELLDSKTVTPAKILNLKKEKNRLKVEEAIKSLDEAKSEDLFKNEAFEKLDNTVTVDDESVTLTHDPIAIVKPKVSGTAKYLFDLIDSAVSSIYLDSPYFIMTKEMKAHLKAAIKRGVKIRLTTNSAKATDGIFPLAGYIGQRKKIVNMGLEVHEFYGEYSFHAKSLVIDERIAAVGSFNFDPRSQKLNTETMAIIEDPKVARQLLDAMNETLLQCYKLDENGRPEGFDFKYPGVSKKKIFLTKLIQFFLVPLVKNQLAPLKE